MGSDAGTSNVSGLTAAQIVTASSFNRWTFGTAGGGNGWVIVDADGTLNNAAGAVGAASPMLLSEYSTTITNAHQLQLIALSLGANYTLANDIDARRPRRAKMFGARADLRRWAATEDGFISTAISTAKAMSSTD